VFRAIATIIACQMAHAVPHLTSVTEAEQPAEPAT